MICNQSNAWIEVPFQFSNKTGVGNYFLTLEMLLKEYVTSSKRISVEHKFFHKIKFRSLQTKVWLNVILYLQAFLYKPNVIIFTNIITPKRKRLGTKYVSAIYDLNYFNDEYIDGKIAEGFKKNTDDIIQYSDTILTISETIKQEIIERYELSGDNIQIVYPSFDKLYLKAQSNFSYLEKYGLQAPSKYILSVATLNKRKNIPALVDAFEKINHKYTDLKLVLVGGMGNDQRAELTCNPNIIFTGYIPDEELPTLYQNALMYVFPSLYEGFGIPILEAQASNTPVLCSDINIFREVGADSVLYCEPTPEGISEKIEELINNPSVAEELMLKGQENIKRFSEDVIKQQVATLLEF